VAIDLILVEKMKIKKLHVKTSIMTGAWCKNMVQMQWKFGRLCFLKGWKEFTEKIKMAVATCWSSGSGMAVSSCGCTWGTLCGGRMGVRQACPEASSLIFLMCN
jgi:hypothetical protein